jgi:hypothetical protein
MAVTIKNPNHFQPEVAKTSCGTCGSKYVLAFQRGRGLQENQCIMKIAKFERSEKAKQIKQWRGDETRHQADLEA